MHALQVDRKGLGHELRLDLHSTLLHQLQYPVLGGPVDQGPEHLSQRQAKSTINPLVPTKEAFFTKHSEQFQ